MIGARPVSLFSFDRQMPDPQSVHAPNVDAGERGSRRRPVLEAAIMLALAVVVVRLVLLEPFSIPSSSMAPTLLPGDRASTRSPLARPTHAAGTLSSSCAPVIPRDRVSSESWGWRAIASRSATGF